MYLDNEKYFSVLLFISCLVTIFFLIAHWCIILDYLLQFRWHVLPMLNPDGYVYTFTKDRLWSKNRRPGEICSGVNINR